MGTYNEAGVTYNHVGLTYNDFTLATGAQDGGWLPDDVARRVVRNIRKQTKLAEANNKRQSDEWKELQESIVDTYDRLAGIKKDDVAAIETAVDEVNQLNVQLSKPKRTMKKAIRLKAQKRRLQLIQRQVAILERYTALENFHIQQNNAIALLLFD